MAKSRYQKVQKEIDMVDVATLKEEIWKERVQTVANETWSRKAIYFLKNWSEYSCHLT